jgi:hypothetical protein
MSGGLSVGNHKEKSNKAKCLPEWAFLFSKQPALDPGEILLDKVVPSGDTRIFSASVLNMKKASIKRQKDR